MDESHAGKTLAAFLRAQIAEISWGQARGLCGTGKVRVNDKVVTDPALRLEQGQQVVFSPTAPRQRAGHLDADAIYYVDREVVVVMKPAGLLSIPYDDEKDTLVDVTRATFLARLQTYLQGNGLGDRIDAEIDAADARVRAWERRWQQQAP